MSAITMTRGSDEIQVSAGQVHVLQKQGWKTEGPATALKQAADTEAGATSAPAMATDLEIAAATGEVAAVKATTKAVKAAAAERKAGSAATD